MFFLVNFSQLGNIGEFKYHIVYGFVHRIVYCLSLPDSMDEKMTWFAVLSNCYIILGTVSSELNSVLWIIFWMKLFKPLYEFPRVYSMLIPCSFVLSLHDSSLTPCSVFPQNLHDKIFFWEFI